MYVLMEGKLAGANRKIIPRKHGLSHTTTNFVRGIDTYIPQTIKQSMSPKNAVLQLFCSYYSWCI
jgi:hypothetical protein